jgi:hypothetical protein
MKTISFLTLSLVMAVFGSPAEASPSFVANDQSGPFCGKVTEAGAIQVTRLDHGRSDSLAFGTSQNGKFSIWYNAGADAGWWRGVYSAESNFYTVTSLSQMPTVEVMDAISAENGPDEKIELLKGDSETALSKDGKLAAIRSGKRMYFVSVETGNIISRRSFPGVVGSGSWTQNSAKFAFLAGSRANSEREGGYTLMVFDVQSGSLESVGAPSSPTSTAFFPASPVWDQNATTLVFTSNYSEKPGWRPAYQMSINSDVTPVPSLLLDQTQKNVSVWADDANIYASAKDQIYTLRLQDVGVPNATTVWNVIPEHWQGRSYRPKPTEGLSLFYKWQDLWLGNHHSGEAKEVAKGVSNRATWIQN